MIPEDLAKSGAGYRELVRTNPNFRNLWFGQIVSELGDWFSTVAIFDLLLELTNRAQVLGWFLIVIHVPSVIMGPLAGLLIDRLDRKRLMIAMDLGRAVLVLGYLLVSREDQVWLVYTIAAFEVAMASLFEPARTAVVPGICRRNELVAANALSSVTWSTMLAIGAGIGGFVAASLGREVCYILDALTFLASALFITRVRIQRQTVAARRAELSWGAAGLADIRAGFRYIMQNPPVLALLFVKTGWCLGGGILLVLGVFGRTVFPVMGSGAAGIGVLYAARGIGTAIGPIAARRLAGEGRASMRTAITVGFFMGSVFYFLFGRLPWQAPATLALMTAHMGGSITWVFSTVLLQIEVSDEFRGRVFALEFALLTLGIAASNFVAGYALDELRLRPQTVASCLGLYFTVPAILWIMAQRLFRRS